MRNRLIDWFSIALLVIFILLITLIAAIQTEATPYIIGLEHLNNSQRQIASSVLNEFEGVVLFTTYRHPLYNGYRIGNTIKIYDIHHTPDYYLPCLLYHEMNEPQRGEIHSSLEVMLECKTKKN